MRFPWFWIGLRDLVFVSVIVGLYFTLVGLLAHQTPNIGVAVTLGLLALLIEGLWLFLRWMSPFRGVFGAPDRELSLWRVLERELSRSMRYGSPMVAVGMRLRHRVPASDVESLLRFSDIVTFGRANFVVIIMTETRIEQAETVIQRFVSRLPVQAIVMADTQVLASQSALTGIEQRHNVQSEHLPTIALVQGLRLGILRAETHVSAHAPPPVYRLTAKDVREANELEQQQRRGAA